MQVELIIKADSLAEIAHLFVAAPAAGQVLATVPSEENTSPETTAEEEVAPAPKKTRTKKADTAKQDTPDTKSSPESSDGPTAPTAASPSEATLEDIRTKASQLMDSGKASGKDIQEMLVEKFDARAFGALKPEQYADVIGELNNL